MNVSVKFHQKLSALEVQMISEAEEGRGGLRWVFECIPTANYK